MRQFGSHWRGMAALMKLDVPLWKQPIFDFLESEGLRFCIDFGTVNAEQKARDLWATVKHQHVIH